MRYDEDNKNINAGHAEVADPADGQLTVDYAILREIPERPNRHTVSLAAVLSPEEVIHLVGGRASVVRRWLRQVRPLPHPTGRRVFVWGDVLAALKTMPIREVE